jgi:hypothetical protein
MQQFYSVDEKLRQVLEDALDIWPAKECIVTSIWRSLREDKAMGGSGVHSTRPHRAMDLRIRNLGGDFQTKAEEVADVLNTIWTYDVTRPTKKVAIAKVHGSGPHIHVQVHERTQRNLVS